MGPHEITTGMGVSTNQEVSKRRGENSPNALTSARAILWNTAQYRRNNNSTYVAG